MSGLLTSALYTAVFWTLYPAANAVAWVWDKADGAQDRRRARLMGPDRWY